MPALIVLMFSLVFCFRGTIFTIFVEVFFVLFLSVRGKADYTLEKTLDLS